MQISKFKLPGQYGPKEKAFLMHYSMALHHIHHIHNKQQSPKKVKD